MKLVYYFEKGWCIESTSGSMTLREFCIKERQRQGRTVSELQKAAGLSHPSYSYYEKGKTDSLRIGLLALQALGYDIFVFGGER